MKKNFAAWLTGILHLKRNRKLQVLGCTCELEAKVECVKNSHLVLKRLYLQQSEKISVQLGKGAICFLCLLVFDRW